MWCFIHIQKNIWLILLNNQSVNNSIANERNKTIKFLFSLHKINNLNVHSIRITSVILVKS